MAARDWPRSAEVWTAAAEAAGAEWHEGRVDSVEPDPRGGGFVVSTRERGAVARAWRVRPARAPHRKSTVAITQVHMCPLTPAGVGPVIPFGTAGYGNLPTRP